MQPSLHLTIGIEVSAYCSVEVLVHHYIQNLHTVQVHGDAHQRIPNSAGMTHTTTYSHTADSHNVLTQRTHTTYSHNNVLTHRWLTSLTHERHFTHTWMNHLKAHQHPAGATASATVQNRCNHLAQPPHLQLHPQLHPHSQPKPKPKSNRYRAMHWTRQWVRVHATVSTFWRLCHTL